MKQVKVWDLATRLFHWLLVLLVVAAWLTIENRMIEAHEFIGHSIFALLLFRLMWGFIGSTTARFSNFVKPPLKALSYLKKSLSLQADYSTGHNPAGGWMVIIMLIFFGFQTISGMLANNDLGFSGALSDSISKSLSDTMTQLHALNFNILLALIWLHLVAVFFYVLVKKTNLVKAMWSGKKLENQVKLSDSLSFVSLFRACASFAIALAIAYWIMF